MAGGQDRLGQYFGERFQFGLAEIVPLTHGVDVCRALTVGRGLGWGILFDLAYLILWGAAGVLLALRTFGRRLVE